MKLCVEVLVPISFFRTKTEKLNVSEKHETVNSSTVSKQHPTGHPTADSRLS